MKTLMRRPLDFHCLQMYVRIYLMSKATGLYLLLRYHIILIMHCLNPLPADGFPYAF